MDRVPGDVPGHVPFDVPGHVPFGVRAMSGPRHVPDDARSVSESHEFLVVGTLGGWTPLYDQGSAVRMAGRDGLVLPGIETAVAVADREV
ncbi:MAG: hypothetical protein WBA45_09185 [Microthrixaceae bacterium]